MKHILLVIFIAFCSVTVKAQLTPPIVHVTDSTIFESVDVSPRYPDGVIALTNFINANLRHVGDKGIVYIAFVVEKDGSITHVYAIKGVTTDAQKEAVRVMRLSKKWIPGTNAGKPVRSAYTLPIRFT